MKYALIEFTYPSEFAQLAYQEINDDGEVINYKDINGNVLSVPFPSESTGLSSTPDKLPWML